MKKVFLDTNVLCYALDESHPEKRAVAQSILEMLLKSDMGFGISTQVMQEFYNTLTRKFKFTLARARAELALLRRFHCVNLNPGIILAAADLHASASLSFWDALFIAAALSANCDELWSEDLQDGRLFGAMKVVNPFAMPNSTA